MLYSKEFTDSLKQTVKMEDLAKRFAELKYNGNVLIGRCPHKKHNDSAPSFRVFPKDNSWCCYGCHSGKKDDKSQRGKNYGSDIFAFVRWMFNLNFPEAVEKICEMYNIEPEYDENLELYKKQERIAKSNHANLNKSMKDYLTQRGLTDETIKKYQIGYNGDSLTIPLLNRQKRHVGFTKRYFEEGAAKYKNSSNSDIFHKSSYFFGIHLLDKEHQELYITEGAFDQILPAQYDVPNVVATLGTAFTEYHAEIIKNLRLVPVIVMDGDEAGINALNKAAELLAKHNIYCKVLVLTDKMDLADLANMHKYDTLTYIQKHAVPYGQYLIQDTLKEYEAKITELNLLYIPELKRSMSLIKSEDERKVVSDRIWRNTGLRL